MTVFRIPYSPKLGPGNDSRPVVFLQHGVLQTADQWLFRGPGRDLRECDGWRLGIWAWLLAFGLCRRARAL